MPLNYPGIDIPPAGLTIRLDAPGRNKRYVQTRQGRGWLRLIIRPSRPPFLAAKLWSNDEAMPEHAPYFNLRFRGELNEQNDEALSRLNVSLSPWAASREHVQFWAKHLIKELRKLNNLHLDILDRDETSARVVIAAEVADEDIRITIEGWLRIVAPDSVPARTAMAPRNNGWLALSNFDREINGDWDLVDGDLDDLPASPGVRAVDLEGDSKLSDSGIYPLSHLPNLEIAHLNNTSVTGVGFRAFQHMQRFCALSANATPLTDQGLRYLEGARLIRLALSETRITNEGLISLGATPLMGALLLLNTFTSDAGLLSLGPMPHLTILQVSRTGVTDAFVSRLPELCPNLENLAIVDTAVSDASISALAALPKLTWIIGGKEAFTPAGVERLKKMRPQMAL